MGGWVGVGVVGGGRVKKLRIRLNSAQFQLLVGAELGNKLSIYFPTV